MIWFLVLLAFVAYICAFYIFVLALVALEPIALLEPTALFAPAIQEIIASFIAVVVGTVAISGATIIQRLDEVIKRLTTAESDLKKV